MSQGAGARIAINAALVFAGKAFASITFIILFVVVSRAYSVEDYGTFRQIWMISKDLTIGCFLFGIPMGILYFLARLAHAGKHQFIWQSVLLLAALGLAASSLIALGAPLISGWFDNAALATPLRLFALYPALMLPTLALESVFISFEKTRYYSSFLAASKLALLIAVVGAVSIDVELIGLLRLILLFATLELIASLLMIRHFSAGMRGEHGNVTLRHQLAYSAPLGLGTAVNILNVELDKFIVSLRLGVEEFAVYANGAVVVPFIGTFAGAATSALIPHLVTLNEAGDRAEALRLWRATIVKLVLIFVPLLGFLFVFAVDFITLLFSDAYRDSAPVFRLYLLSQLPKIIYFSPFLMAIGQTRAPLTGALLGLTANAGLSWMMIDWFGLSGPALATLIANVLVSGYYARCLAVNLQAGLGQVFPFGPTATVLGISLLAAYALQALLGAFDVPDPGLIALGIAGVLQFAVVALVAFALGLLTREDLIFLRHRGKPPAKETA